jgi:hypothetical protein
MKTKLDIIKILRENKRGWCESGIKRNLKILENFKDTDTIDVIAKEIESQDAYYWALRIGDTEIMRDRVTKSYDALNWAIKIGDREIMRDRVTKSWDIDKWIEFWPHDEDYFVKKGLL